MLGFYMPTLFGRLLLWHAYTTLLFAGDLYAFQRMRIIFYLFIPRGRCGYSTSLNYLGIQTIAQSYCITRLRVTSAAASTLTVVRYPSAASLVNEAHSPPSRAPEERCHHPAVTQGPELRWSAHPGKAPPLQTRWKRKLQGVWGMGETTLSFLTPLLSFPWQRILARIVSTRVSANIIILERALGDRGVIRPVWQTDCCDSLEFDWMRCSQQIHRLFFFSGPSFFVRSSSSSWGIQCAVCNHSLHSNSPCKIVLGLSVQVASVIPPDCAFAWG